MLELAKPTSTLGAASQGFDALPVEEFPGFPVHRGIQMSFIGAGGVVPLRRT